MSSLGARDSESLEAAANQHEAAAAPPASKTWPARLYRWIAGSAALTLIVGMVLWVHLYEFSAIVQWDSYVLLIIGKYVARGLLPYRDLWEMKPPGIFWYLGGVFSVLPTAMWSVRIADFLLYLCGAGAFYKLCRGEANRAVAVAGTGLWVYFAHHPRFNFGGVYTDEYPAICEVLAMAAAASYYRSGRYRAVLLSGLAAAAAILCKHPGAAVAAPALVLVTGRRPVRAFALFTAAAVIPIVLTIAYFWHRGALAEFLDCNLWVLLPYGGLTHPSGGWLWERAERLIREMLPYLREFPVLAGALGVGLPVCLLRPTRLRLAAIVWLAFDLVGIAVQGRYYQHYFIQMFPSLFLVGALGAAWYVQFRPGDRWFMRVLRPVIVAVALVWAWPLANAAFSRRQRTVRQEWEKLLAGPSSWQQDPGGPVEAAIGKYVRDRTRPGDRLQVFAWQATALGIYWTADRDPASRYLYPNVLSGIRGAELLDALERTKPEYVLVITMPGFNFRPYLVERYSLEAVKWPSYRVEIWARKRAREFSTGASMNLDKQLSVEGLGLRQDGEPLPRPAALTRLKVPQHGWWTSPVVPIRSDDGKVVIDWSQRSDLAANHTGVGLPRAEASWSPLHAPAQAVAGAPTLADCWTTYPRSGPIDLTVDLGCLAVTNQVVLVGTRRLATDDVQRLHLTVKAGTTLNPQDFTTVRGEWQSGEEGQLIYRFPPQVLSSVRLSLAPDAPEHGVELHRIHVPAVGMGITVRYRTGPEPNLDGAPWMPVPDSEPPVWVQGDRYVQIQCELWSEYKGLSPILRYTQIGRERFQMGGGGAAGGPTDWSRAR